MRSRGLPPLLMFAAAGFAALSAGCELPSSTQLTFNRAQLPPPLKTVVIPGRYSLYAGDELEPVRRVELAKGDRYGFVKQADDSIVAVAKDREYRIGDKLVDAWHWKARADE